LKEEALVRTLWRIRFDRGYGMNEWIIVCCKRKIDVFSIGQRPSLPLSRYFHIIRYQSNLCYYQNICSIFRNLK
jgi:hypothetical protein